MKQMKSTGGGKTKNCPRCKLPCFSEIDKGMFLCGTCGEMNQKLSKSKVVQAWLHGVTK